MEQESFLDGGVALSHTVVNGKHCYEVGKVLTSTPTNFGRKGDKLMMVNDVETQHLPPRMLARMLSSGSPVLTMHQTSVDETNDSWPNSDNMKPYHKEQIQLHFSLNMVNEACLDKEEENPQVPDEFKWESCDTEANSSTNKDMLLVSLTNTSVAIMQGRGCDVKNPCNSCGGSGCTFNDLVVVAKQSTVTSACKEYIQKRCEKGQVLIQSLLQQPISPENILYPGRKKGDCIISRSTTEEITIYYYISNAKDDFDKGVPVVLNFSHSTNFLKCNCDNGKPVLTVECCEKNKLQSINKGDPNTWPFVFYLKTTKDNHRRFESAAYSGWFIHVTQDGLVDVDAGSDYTESTFYIIIHLGND